jgi:hypothetical protein
MFLRCVRTTAAAMSAADVAVSRERLFLQKKKPV